MYKKGVFEKKRGCGGSVQEKKRGGQGTRETRKKRGRVKFPRGGGVSLPLTFF